MEFFSWNELIEFYYKYLQKGYPKSVYFIMDRHDHDQLLGFLEFNEAEEEIRSESFTAKLRFPYTPEYKAFYGLTFYPCKCFLLPLNHDSKK